MDKVFLDGNYYEKCTFTNCILVYQATGEVGFDSCKLINCNWSFEGPAAKTINFLRGMYHGFGPANQKVVENLFDQIRSSEEIEVKQP